MERDELLKRAVDTLRRARAAFPADEAPPTPAPRPGSVGTETTQKDRDKRRQRVMAAGRQGTILTQGLPLTGNSTLLGRSFS